MSDQDGGPGRAGPGGRAGRGQARGSGDDSRPSWRDDRIWQAGFLLGSALGAAATVAGRHAEKAARRGLVDWPEVERIAIGRLAKAPGTLDEAELLKINALEADDTAGPTTTATHLQLTTGDPGSFHALASRLFGSAFPEVAHIELAVAAR